MSLREQVRHVLEHEWDVLRRRHGVRRIGLFGSAARGDSTETSDVDVLVEFEGTTFDRYMDVKFLLEDRLGRHVDLVTAGSLKPRLRERVLREVEYVEGR